MERRLGQKNGRVDVSVTQIARAGDSKRTGPMPVPAMEEKTVLVEGFPGVVGGVGDIG